MRSEKELFEIMRIAISQILSGEDWNTVEKDHGIKSGTLRPLWKHVRQMESTIKSTTEDIHSMTERVQDFLNFAL